jgi:hypothetical protein
MIDMRPEPGGEGGEEPGNIEGIIVVSLLSCGVAPPAWVARGEALELAIDEVWVMPCIRLTGSSCEETRVRLPSKHRRSDDIAM